nr:hypothetical protein [Luteimonas sp. MC1750]
MPLAAPWQKRAALRFHLKARVELADGVVRARVLHGQESFKVQPLIDANAWIVVPAATMAFAAGDMVEVYAPGHAEGLKFEEVAR